MVNDSLSIQIMLWSSEEVKKWTPLPTCEELSQGGNAWREGRPGEDANEGGGEGCTKDEARQHPQIHQEAWTLVWPDECTLSHHCPQQPKLSTPSSPFTHWLRENEVVCTHMNAETSGDILCLMYPSLINNYPLNRWSSHPNTEHHLTFNSIGKEDA